MGLLQLLASFQDAHKIGGSTWYTLFVHARSVGAVLGQKSIVRFYIAMRLIAILDLCTNHTRSHMHTYYVTEWTTVHVLMHI